MSLKPTWSDDQQASQRLETEPRFRSACHAAAFAVLCLCQGVIADAAHAADATRPAATAKVRAAEVTGRYYLEGVHEVGAELVLHEDGRFQFGMAYGGAEHSAEGAWQQQDRKVVLVTDARPEPSFKWRKGQPARDERCYEEDSTPTALIVCIRTPVMAVSWSGVEITAEFANGLRRSGVTGRNGKLLFEARGEPEWKGVPVTRIQVAYPRHKVPGQWFDVPKGADTALVELEPGRMIQPAFETATLRIVQSQAGQPELVMLGRDGSDGQGRYVRR